MVRVKQVKTGVFEFNPDLQVLLVLIDQLLNNKMSKLALSKVSCAVLMMLKKLDQLQNLRSTL